MSAEALAGLYDSRVKSSPNDDSSSIVDWHRLKTGGRLLAGPDHLRNWNALTRELDAAALAALRHLPDHEAAQVVAELQRKGDAIRNPSAWVTKTCQGVQNIARATAYYPAPPQPPGSQGT